MSADLLTRVRADIDARLDTLRPALAEYERLLGAYDTLEADAAKAPTPSPRARAAGAIAASLPAPARVAGQPRHRGPRGSAAGALKRAASAPAPAPRGAAQRAIVAALEHGSHTVAELVLVTAIPAAEIRKSARSLQRAGAIAATKRDGRAAYALSGPAAV